MGLPDTRINEKQDISLVTLQKSEYIRKIHMFGRNRRRANLRRKSLVGELSVFGSAIAYKRNWNH
jgi:hypothetical protein